MIASINSYSLIHLAAACTHLALLATRTQNVRGTAATITRQTGGDLQRTTRTTENELTLRVDEILQRKQDLQRAIEAVFQETGNMLNHKDVLQQELQAKTLPLEIAHECAEYRARRFGIDNVDDYVDRQLAEVGRYMPRRHGSAMHGTLVTGFLKRLHTVTCAQ